ncbi:unnamed protein product [Paramecium octaurelia]|uniref:Uncharacterized protein n=1 Tax=Paramecium octaurelia TaxID=43137 RepID=A0A8S1YNY7_PAROT|nr:unnamed protein product [Paramecium octaurelia]
MSKNEPKIKIELNKQIGRNQFSNLAIFLWVIKSKFGQRVLYKTGKDLKQLQ